MESWPFETLAQQFVRNSLARATRQQPGTSKKRRTRPSCYRDYEPRLRHLVPNNHRIATRHCPKARPDPARPQSVPAPSHAPRSPSSRNNLPDPDCSFSVLYPIIRARLVIEIPLQPWLTLFASRPAATSESRHTGLRHRAALNPPPRQPDSSDLGHSRARTSIQGRGWLPSSCCGQCFPLRRLRQVAGRGSAWHCRRSAIGHRRHARAS